MIHYYQSGLIASYLVLWLVGVTAAIILIELTFRKIFAIQNQLEDISTESRLLERQQNSLLRLAGKLAAITDVQEICQIVSSELKETLGDGHNVICTVHPTDQESPNESLPFSSLLPGAHSDPSDDTEMYKTRVRYAMQVGDKTIGELFVGSNDIDHFSQEDLSIIAGVTNQAALAIENASLLEQHASFQVAAEHREGELKLRERTLNLLSEITRETLKSRDIQTMLQTLVEYLAKLMEADNALIFLWDENRGQALPVSAAGPLRQMYRSLQFDPDELSAINSVLNSGRMLEIKNASSSPYVSPRLSAQYHIKSLLALPLIADNQKLGAALLSYKTEHSFSPREVSLGEQASSQLALAIAKSRALDAAHHRAQELSALQKATAALLTTLDLEVLLGQILDAAISAISAAEKGTLHLLARDTGQLQLRAVQGYTDPRIRTFNPTDSASFPAAAVRERKPLLVHDANADPQTRYGGDIPEIRAISSMIIAPLILGGRTLGAISLDAYRRYAFTDADLQLLVSFAATATTAIHNAQLYTEVQRQAITDPLTGLYNRRGFFELGRREVERAHRFARPLTAMMIDIDLLKQVNDTLGHLVGDQVLAGVASQIEHQLRQVDLPGRYGGDEFLALLPETDLAHAYQAAERLRRAISQCIFPTENETVKVTVSIGLAELNGGSESLETLIERSDQAMYAAKQSGRNLTKLGGSTQGNEVGI